MVHPDKCKHARAKDAFEVIGEAQKQLLDEEKRAKLSFLLQHAKGERWGPRCLLRSWRRKARRPVMCAPHTGLAPCQPADCTCVKLCTPIRHPC